MMTLGQFLTHWTGGQCRSRGLVDITAGRHRQLALVYQLHAPNCVNQHQRLAAGYLFGTSITVVLTYLLAKHLGLYWAAASLLVSGGHESLRAACDTAPLHDTPALLCEHVTTRVLRPGALISRLPMRRPGLNPRKRALNPLETSGLTFVRSTNCIFSTSVASAPICEHEEESLV
jgi:hypothetical protein